MRAAFYEGARTFRTGTLPEPKPAAGEALLRVRRVGICGTDLHIFEGHLDHRVPRGGIIGHETVAEVVEAPAGSGFTAGAPTYSATWPADLAETNTINIGDVLALKPVFGTAVPPTSPRFDLAISGGINIGDVLAIKPVFGASCTP